MRDAGHLLIDRRQSHGAIDALRLVGRAVEVHEAGGHVGVTQEGRQLFLVGAGIDQALGSGVPQIRGRNAHAEQPLG
ncbi:hypothetical protein D3C72_1697870 [compost metagenome]